MDPIRLNDGRNGNGNDGFGGQQTTLQSLNNSADLLLSLSAYNLHQVQQQQQQQQLLLQQQQQSQQQNTQFQLIPQQQQQPPTTQFQLIPQQQQQQAFLPFTFPANTMAVTSNSGTASPPNSGSVGHSYPDRERQIKRRTKTGCMTCRKRRIKCDEAKPICLNCQKSRRDCEGYTQGSNTRSESTSPPQPSTQFQYGTGTEYSTPSTLGVPRDASSSFSPINHRKVPLTPSPRFAPYDVFQRSPQLPVVMKEFDPLQGSEYLATSFANEEFVPEVSPSLNDDLSTPPPTARISIDSLLNLSSAALVYPPIDAPLNALSSPTTSLLPPALLKSYNAGLFAHWINILSQAMGTLDRFPMDSSVLEGTPGIHYPNVRVPHEDSVYSFLIPHLAMAPTGTGVLRAIFACAASHRRERHLGMKHYHLAVNAIRADTEKGVSYFVAVVLLGMYEVLGGKGIRCMYLARDWILDHKSELKDKIGKDDDQVTVRDVIIEHMKWTFARTAIHRGLGSLPSISPREGFILPMNEFREIFIPREGGDSTVGVADSLIILLAQVLSLPTLGESELKAHVAHQLNIWPATLPRAFRHQWTSQNTISTTSLHAIHFLHPSLAAIHLLHRAGIIYFSIYFSYHPSHRTPTEPLNAARDVLRITQPLIDEATTGRWSVLGALTLAFGPVFVAGQFLKYHLRDAPFTLPQMDWLEGLEMEYDGSCGIGESEEDKELREVERMIDRLKVYLGGVQGRVMEL